MVSTCPFRDCLTGLVANGTNYNCARVPRKSHGALPNGTSATLYKNGPAVDRARDVYRTMRGDAWYAQTSSLLERNVLGKTYDMLSRYDNKVCGGSKRAVALGAEAPHSLADARRCHLVSYFLDDASAVVVGNNARVRHS